VIARLRARHRRMWIALVVVAPVVIGEARSVRRGEAARQSLSTAMTSELPPEQAAVLDDSTRTAGAGTVGHWVIEKDVGGGYYVPGSDGFVDIDISMGPPFEGDVVVYWSKQTASTETTTSDRVLPDDAVLLGAWPASGKATLPFPNAALQSRAGALLWYSLTHASVVKVRPVADLYWTLR
jgi:hypothetical protein